jgi:hypothetical protein
MVCSADDCVVWMNPWLLYIAEVHFAMTVFVDHPIGGFRSLLRGAHPLTSKMHCRYAKNQLAIGIF